MLIRWRPSVPSDANRFQRKSPCAIRERLSKIPVILDIGVESRTDGIHRIYRTRTDSNGNVYVLFVREFHPDDMDIGVESRSDGIHRFYRIRIDSDGKVHVLFGDTLRIDTYIGY